MSAQKTTALFNIIRAQADEIHNLRNELFKLHVSAPGAAESAPAASFDMAGPSALASRS